MRNRKREDSEKNAVLKKDNNNIRFIDTNSSRLFTNSLMYT